MSFFHKLFKPKEQPVYPPYISVIRYVKDTWFELFPKSTEEEWKKKNYPESVDSLLKDYVIFEIMKDPGILDHLKEVKILTIDNCYTKWLKDNNLLHGPLSIKKYTEEHINDNEFWDERFNESNMTNNTHFLGIPFTSLIVNTKDNKTNYKLSNEAADELSNFIKEKYKAESVYVPGWIIKGADIKEYTKSIDVMANEYFQNHRHVRMGQCEEQCYKPEELKRGFIPLPFFIPVVFNVKATTHNHHVMKSDLDEQEKYEYAPNTIPFTDDDISFLSKIISEAAPGFVECAHNLATSEFVSLMYSAVLRRKTDISNTKFF